MGNLEDIAKVGEGKESLLHRATDALLLGMLTMIDGHCHSTVQGVSALQW